MIETSICIGKRRKELLLSVAEKMEISVSGLLHLLIERSRILFGDTPVLFKAVRYQRFSDDDGQIMHISIPAIAYEYATAQRYIFKISVSFIFRLCVDILLQNIVEEHAIQKKETHQPEYVSTNSKASVYTKTAYSIDHSISYGFEHWKINWQRQNT